MTTEAEPQGSDLCPIIRIMSGLHTEMSCSWFNCLFSEWFRSTAALGSYIYAQNAVMHIPMSGKAISRARSEYLIAETAVHTILASGVSVYLLDYKVYAIILLMLYFRLGKGYTV